MAKTQLPVGVQDWRQYDNKPCEHTKIAVMYNKAKNACLVKMKKSNNDSSWPKHLITERTMHFLMQTVSKLEHQKQLAEWMAQASDGTAFINGSTKKKKTAKLSNEEEEVFEGTGYENALKKLELLEKKAAKQLNELIDSDGDLKELATTASTYNTIISQLHKLKKDSYGIYEEDGGYMKREEVSDIFLPILSNMKNDLTAEFDMAGPALASMTNADKITAELQKIKVKVLKKLTNKLKEY